MKKFLFLLLMLCMSLCTQAQSLQEVRGVETKIDCENDGDFDYICVTFTNQNSFPISVDTELWATRRDEERTKIIATKQFEMAPHESYIWHTDKAKSNDIITLIFDEYVKYKAYKSPNLVTE